MSLSQALNADRSCQNAVDDWFISRQGSGLSRVSTNTGAYCRARQRLPTEMISELVRHSGKQLTVRLPERWKCKGRDVKIVDGTTLSMPELMAMAQKRVGNRQGRIRPRLKKRRPKPYQWLKKFRQFARRDVIKHGH